MVLIRVRREMRAMEDNKIVDLYLSRNELAIKQSKEKYGRRLQSLACCTELLSHARDVKA